MIIGSAIRNEFMMIFLPKPARHADCFRLLFEKCGEVIGKEIALTMNGKGQGFITDKGVYLDRWQAMKHVKRCGQRLIHDPDCKHRWSDPLCSEDLW